jgi:hypothetical protein
MSDAPETIETKLIPTHYYESTGDGKFDITSFDPQVIPVDNDKIHFMHVVSNDLENPLITIVDKEGNVLAEEIVPDGLQDAVKKVLNPTSGGRRRRSRRQSKRNSRRQSKRQNGGRRQSKRRDSKRRQRR